MRLKLILIIVLLSGAVLTRLQAQEAIIATGGDALGSGGSVCYSIGQMVYTTRAGVSGVLMQGVQIPFEIFVITGIEEAEEISLVARAYPNPTTDYLTLKVDGFERSGLSFQLYDMNGKLIENKKVESNETTITMTHLLPAVYFLKVVQIKDSFSQQVKTFKIAKN